MPINSNWYHHLSGCIFSPLAALGVLFCTIDHRFNLNNLVVYSETMKGDYEMVSQDFSSSGFTNWAFMTTHSWGENPIGKWQVDIFTTSLPSFSISKTAGYRAMWILNSNKSIVVFIVFRTINHGIFFSLRSTTTRTATGVRRQNSSAGRWSFMEHSRILTQTELRIELGICHDSADFKDNDDFVASSFHNWLHSGN